MRWKIALFVLVFACRRWFLPELVLEVFESFCFAGVLITMHEHGRPHVHRLVYRRKRV